MTRASQSRENDRLAHQILNKLVELYNQLAQATSNGDNLGIAFIKERIKEERADLNKLKIEEGIL